MPELFGRHLAVAWVAKVLCVRIVVAATEGERDLVVDHLGERRAPLVEAAFTQPIGAIEPSPPLSLPCTTTQTWRSLFGREYPRPLWHRSGARLALLGALDEELVEAWHDREAKLLQLGCTLAGHRLQHRRLVE